MKAYIESEGTAPRILELCVWCECAASRPGKIMPGQRTSCNHLIWDCVRCRASLGISETRKSLASTGIRIPVYTACSSVTILTIHCLQFLSHTQSGKISFHKHG